MVMESDMNETVKRMKLDNMKNILKNLEEEDPQVENLKNCY